MGGSLKLLMWQLGVNACSSNNAANMWSINIEMLQLLSNDESMNEGKHGWLIEAAQRCAIAAHANGLPHKAKLVILRVITKFRVKTLRFL